MNETSIEISATCVQEGRGPIMKGNAKVRFAYDDYSKGQSISMFLQSKDGCTDLTEHQIVIDYEELKRVLEFLNNVK